MGIKFLRGLDVNWTQEPLLYVNRLCHLRWQFPESYSVDYNRRSGRRIWRYPTIDLSWTTEVETCSSSFGSRASPEMRQDSVCPHVNNLGIARFTVKLDAINRDATKKKINLCFNRKRSIPRASRW